MLAERPVTGGRERRADAVLVHFYRAVVAHMDVWRQRMDATTNWAAATAAAMITFSFSTVAAPHYVLLLALVFQGVFLIMEARRYQTFDLWRRRFRKLNRALILPALLDDPLTDEAEAELKQIATDMGRTVPHLHLLHAIGYRTRRNYIFLFAVTLLAWLMKLEVQGGAASSAGEFVRRAGVAFVPGELVLGLVLAVLGGLALLAVTVPTGDMLDWEATAPHWERWSARARRARGFWGERGTREGEIDDS